MDFPISYLLEKLVKTTLKDYIVKDGLILDSFSLFDASVNLKNIELKEQKKIVNGLTIELLNGIICDLSIDGSIFTKRINIDISNISLCLYIPNLDSILYSYPKQKKITYDPAVKYSLKDNAVNGLYKALNGMSVFNITCNNLIVNVFTEIEGTLVHFVVSIGQLKCNSDKPKSEKEEEEEESIETTTQNFFISDINLMVNFSEVNKRNVYSLIQNNAFDNAVKIIEKTTLNIKIKSAKPRFERDNNQISFDYNHYESFNSFGRNNTIEIEVPNIKISVNDDLITSALLLCHKIKLRKEQKQVNLMNGKSKLRNIVKKLKNYNTSKNKKFKFTTPKTEQARTYLKIIKYLTYISLIMKQKKYIDFDLNFYSVQKLVTEYKNHIIGPDHFILDYLIQENISSFANSPPIAGGNSLFLNMDIFSNLKQTTMNNTLKSFMIFILEKYIICRKCIDDYNSYDDFHFIKLSIANADFNLLRSIPVLSDTIEDDEEETKYVNDLEMAARAARDNFLNEDEDFESSSSSNILLNLNLNTTEVTLYTNAKEHFLLSASVLSINLNDISYREENPIKINTKSPNQKNVIVPLIKIEYETEFQIFIVNKKICKVGINVANVNIICDPFCIYFMCLYLLNIQHRYMIGQKTEKEKTGLYLIQNGLPMKKREMSSSFLIQSEKCDIFINNIIINFAHTHLSAVKNDESIILQVTRISVNSNNVDVIIKVDEVLCGSVENFDYIDFLHHRKILKFQTNILNIFDIQQKTAYSEIKQNKLNLPLNNIVIEINKKDIDNFYKVSAEFQTLQKFKPYFQSDLQNFEPIPTRQRKSVLGKTFGYSKEKLDESTECEKTFNYEGNILRFITFSICKIIVHINLNEDENAKFKHIIAVINDLTTITIQKENILIHVASISSLNIFHNHLTKFSILKFESERNPFKIKNFTQIIHEDLVNSLEKVVDCFESGTFDGYLAVVENNVRRKIYCELPEVKANFDYVLLRYVKEFLNFESNKIIKNFFSCIDDEYFGLLAEYTEKYSETEKKKEATDLLNRKSKKNTIVLKVDSIDLECIAERKKFISAQVDEIEVKFEQKSFTLSSVIKHVIDNRAFAQKKKILLIKKSYSKSSFLAFTLSLDLLERKLSLTFDNARLTFLMRVVFDITEYFYKIIFVDIINGTNYSEMYNEDILSRIQQIQKKSKKSSNKDLKNLPYFQLVKKIVNARRQSRLGTYLSSTSSMNSSNLRNRTKVKFGTIMQGSQININSFNVEKPPLVVSIVVTNSEIGICMNSLKEEELTLTFSNFEFVMHCDKDKEENLINMYNSFKHSCNSDAFDFGKVEFFVACSDVKVKKVIERSEKNNIKSIEIINFCSPLNKRVTEQEDSGSTNNLGHGSDITVLFENVKHDNVLSTMKIAAIIPYLKVKMFTDVYEELLRIVFENFAEQRQIFSEATKNSTDFFSKQTLKYFDGMIPEETIQNFLTSQNIVCLIKETLINVYYYPAKCSLHKMDKKTPKTHVSDLEVNCEFAKFPNVELERLCEMRIYNLAYVLKMFSNYTKYNLITMTSAKIEVNKNLSVANNLPTMTIMEVKNKKKESDSSQEDILIKVEITSGRHLTTKYDIVIDNAVINYYPITITALNRFFSKYFFYYRNIKVKNILHEGWVSEKIVNTTLHNSSIYFKEFVNTENQPNVLYDVEFLVSIEIVMTSKGNTCIGPFSSFNRYVVFVHSGSINTKSNSHSYGDDEIGENSDYYSGQSQFLDQFKLSYETYSCCAEKFGDERRSYSLLKLIHSGGLSYATPDVVTDDPSKFREFIAKYRFKEEDEIKSNADYYASYYDESIKNSFEGEMNMNNSNCIRVSLNINQLNHIYKIFTDITKNYNERAKMVLPTVNIKTAFGTIIYHSSFSVYINEIDIKICDTQFNAQLFQIVVSKLMGFISNCPDNTKLHSAVEKLSKKFSTDMNYGTANQNGNGYQCSSNETDLMSEDGDYIDEKYVKCICKVNYYNSSQSKIKKDDKSDRMQTTMFVNDNRSFYEPFIEPMPLKFTSLSSADHQLMKLEVLSLKPIYDGNRICRQRKFHSLNINLNERLMENVNSLTKDLEKVRELNKSTISVSHSRKKLTVLNLTEYEMILKSNSSLEEIEDNNKEVRNAQARSKKKNKYVFNYKPCKKIDDKDDIGVYFLPDETDLNEFEYTTYNIERQSKFFFIQRNSKNGGILNPKDEREELKKNFDNKASILLNGEYFLVCEVEIQKNKKYVTFRSNEGIKNELDFPVQIKLILKEKTNKSDITVILTPGKYFYIPPFYLENIKEIQFKPFGFDLIKFSHDSYPYSETSFKLNRMEGVYVLTCGIKEIRTEDFRDERVPFNDNIVFCVSKSQEKIEGEFLDEKIKEKIEFIKSYQKYNNDAENRFDISKVISDVVYVLTPIVKFYNNLPKELSLKKMIPSDYMSKKIIAKAAEIKNYFDVENYIKDFRSTLESSSSKDSEYNPNIKQGMVEDYERCNYDTYLTTQSPRKTSYKYDTSTIIKPNDYLSIYEPFILTAKGCKHLHYFIKVHDGEKELTFDVKPFNFTALIKSVKNANECEYNMISFPKIIKDNSLQFKSTSERNYFVSTLEINENHVLSEYFYCPFLFLNCSDMNLEIRYKDYKRKLISKNISEVDPDHDFLLKNRVAMFNPTENNHFQFYLGNVTIKKMIHQVMKSEYANSAGDGDSQGIGLSTIKDGREKMFDEISLSSQWRKIQILDISKFGGITVDLTSSRKFLGRRSQIEQRQIDLGEKLDGAILSTPDNTAEIGGFNLSRIGKQKQKVSIPVNEVDQKLTFSLQMKLLPKYSTLIFITASIYVVNQTQKDIYIYHLPHNKNLPIKSCVFKAMTNSKFHYLIDYYNYVQLSFEDKYNSDKSSGLINFSLEEIKNKEFCIMLGDPRKEPLLVLKVFEEKGFKYVLMTQKENVNDYPYVIINKLNMPISFKQKEIDGELNTIYSKTGTGKKIHSHTLKEGITGNNPQNGTNAVIGEGLSVSVPNGFNSGSNEDKIYYAWEEPLMYDKERNTNILEIRLFGIKFEIDPQEIQKDVTFADRTEAADAKSYIDNIIDSPILKGKIRILDKKYEYNYELYKHAFVLKSTDEEKEPVVFEFHDQNLICERKYNGNFTMKLGMKEYEMFCVSIDETNDLVEKMNIFFKKAREFSNELLIKKYAKNRCIYVEITQKKNAKVDIVQSILKSYFISIENIGISFMSKHKEFMYIWFKNVLSMVHKEDSSENNVLYRNVLLKIKDYQIDNYAKRLYYPVVISPLSDKSYDANFKDYYNIRFVINNLQMTDDLYQVDLIYLNITPLDIRFENKFIENLNAFINKVRMCFDNNEHTKIKKLNDYVNEVEHLKFIECNKLVASESRVHVKQICIDDIKICFSLKFDNIDLFLETSSFLFLKPLIEELGLRILNLDSSLFSFPNYNKINVYQNTQDFTRTILSFLFQQFISELVKALGGISSITSIQLVENLNSNFLSNIKGQTNSLERYREKKGFKELYQSGYEKVSTIVGGIFILAYKMMATVGRIFSTLTLDEKYKKRRSYIINKSVKSLCNGMTISFELLVLAFFYMFAQFYYVPRKYSKAFHWIIVLLISSLIIIIGLFWKPVCGFFDFLTKIMEAIGVTINDIMSERVKVYARFPRCIRESSLREYNSTDALASFAKDCIDRDHHKAKTGDISLAVPGLFKERRVLVLLSVDRLMIVEYNGEFTFKEIILVHFSSLDLYDDPTQIGKSELKDNFVCFTKGKDDKGRKIEISLKRRGCFSFYKRNITVTLDRLQGDDYVSRRYDAFIRGIITNKNEVNEKIEGN